MWDRWGVEKGAALLAELRDGPWGLRLDALAEALGAPMALVGGFVRDALLQRSAGDVDVVTLGEPGVALPALARSLPGVAAVPLDPARGYWRLAYPDGNHMDVARAEGGSLEADLLRRDFTINALALMWPSGELLDPTGGLADLDSGTLRLPRPDALAQDPLRVLRAWRFAARLGFNLPPDARVALQEATPALAGVAGERLWVELAAWLAVPALPNATALHIEGILAALGLGSLGQAHTVARAQLLGDWWATHQASASPAWVPRLGEALVGGRSRWSILVASSLADGPEALEAMAARLRWGKAELQWAHSALAGAAYLGGLGPQPGPRGLHRFLAVAGPALPGALCLVGLGQSRAWPFQPALPDPESPWAPDLDAVAAAWAWAQAREAKPWPRFLDGLEATRLAGLKPGPMVAQLLKELSEAQAAGEVRTLAEATAWAEAWRPRA